MRYVKIFFEQCKLSISSIAMYRINFWLMVIQSIINSLIAILCVEFIYDSVTEIAGWNKNEMIILICTALIVNQIFRGIVHFNQNNFIRSVRDGEFDRMLLRPVNLIFQINTGYIDTSCLISGIAPVIILIAKMDQLNNSFDPIKSVLFILFILNGVVLLSALMLLLYSSVFLFIRIDGLDNIYYLLMEIANKPKEMFEHSFMFEFLFALPIIPLANIPAGILLNRTKGVDMCLSISESLIFIILAIIAIRCGKKKYSSASS